MIGFARFRPSFVLAVAALAGLSGIPLADGSTLGGGLNLGEEAGSSSQSGPPFAANGDDCLTCDTTGTSDPVELATGELKLSRTDLTFPGLLEPFAISFTYYSQRHYNGHYGYGWYFPYEMRLFQHASGDVRWRVGTAEPQRFRMDPGSGSLQSPDAYHVELVKQVDGTFIMTERTGIKYGFSAEGLLETITDRVGNQTLIAWEEVGGVKTKFPVAGPASGEIVSLDYRIAKITTDLGHEINFSYYGNMNGSAEGRLKTISDDYGRAVDYSYDSEGNLNFVTSPETTYQSFSQSTPGAVATGRRNTEYQYSPKIVQRDRSPAHPLEHNLEKVIDDRGLTQLENVYDSNDRVTTQHFNNSSTSILYTLAADGVRFKDDGNRWKRIQTRIHVHGYATNQARHDSLRLPRRHGLEHHNGLHLQHECRAHVDHFSRGKLR